MICLSAAWHPDDARRFPVLFAIVRLWRAVQRGSLYENIRKDIKS